MNGLLKPWHVLAATLAGVFTEHQREVIEYLREENRILRQQLGSKRLRLTDAQRCRLAVRGKVLGRRLLAEACCIVTPDTMLRWHRKLVAQKWDHSAKRGPGRPRVMAHIRSLVVRMVQDNDGWGYSHISGELGKLGHRVGRTTIANILKEHGIEPAPERSRRGSWGRFLRSHWESISATDFFTVEVWTARGLVTYDVLFVIELSTRRVHIAGMTRRPNEDWMRHIARQLTDPFDGVLSGQRFLLLDRDTKFSEGFRSMMTAAGVSPVRLPPRSPNLNAYAERFVRSIKEECVNRLIIFGERHLWRTLMAYEEHYNRERPHQGIGNRVLGAQPEACGELGEVIRRERLGGLLRSYERRAA